MMNELNLFAKLTLEKGGEWWQLEESNNYVLCESKTKFTIKHQVYYDQPVFHIFSRLTGKRLFASTNYFEAMNRYRQLVKEEKR